MFGMLFGQVLKGNKFYSLFLVFEYPEVIEDQVIEMFDPVVDLVSSASLFVDGYLLVYPSEKSS